LISHLFIPKNDDCGGTTVTGASLDLGSNISPLGSARLQDE
jgi:hypothetical protein